MKLLIELDIDVYGKISEERLGEVILILLNQQGALMSEQYGDNDQYALLISSAEVKEVK